MGLFGKDNLHMWVKGNPSEEKFLRTPVPLFDFSSSTQEERSELIGHMEKMMKTHYGVGLSANQIGLPLRVFIARLPGSSQSRYQGPLYSIFNPSLIKKSFRKEWGEEGCLSIPGVYGEVKRHRSVVLRGYDIEGKEIEIDAHGFLARIFQHEFDHLEGVLFTDKARNSITRND